MAASLTFVGTATTVLQLGGSILLTDPNLIRRGQRVHLGYGDPHVVVEHRPTLRVEVQAEPRHVCQHRT
jgi:hypothetical protein